MKPNTHPKYVKSIVKCACGASFETRSTEPKILVEICSACHPFYSGKKKIIDTTGRVERFKKMMAKKKPKTIKAKKTKGGKKEEKIAHSTDSISSPQASSEQEAKKT